jgi:hypothetical protein
VEVHVAGDGDRDGAGGPRAADGGAHGQGCACHVRGGQRAGGGGFGGGGRGGQGAFDAGGAGGLVGGVVDADACVHTSVDDHADEHEQHDEQRRGDGDFRGHGPVVSAPPRQAALLRWTKTDLTLAEVNRHGQQLFLAGLRQRGNRARSAAKPKPLPARAGPSLLPPQPVVRRQLTLIDLPRDLVTGKRGGFPQPTNPEAATYLLDRMREHATRRGWSAKNIERSRRAIEILLALHDTPGTPTKTSVIHQMPTVELPAELIREFLAINGWLDDDRTPVIETWSDTQVAGLPDQLTASLDYRTQHWPRTANPHMLIHHRNALGPKPVDARWPGLVSGTAARNIPTDRILDDVRATRDDLRRICVLFGMSVAGTAPYAAILDLVSAASQR